MNPKTLPTLSLVKNLGATATPILLYHLNKNIQRLVEKQNQTLEVNKQLLALIKDYIFYIRKRNDDEDSPKPYNARNGGNNRISAS